ncbi:MAG: transglutaminase family protein [Planctomycetaceae bacterium]|nr:transglutaminase family protein [Planctomycetaceae bacterium]
MKYQVTHTTAYLADVPVSLCHNVAWLTPRDTSTQRCEYHELRCDPQPSVTSRHVDAFGNYASYFSFNEGYLSLDVTAVSRVRVNDPQPPEPAETPAWELIRDHLTTYEQPDELDALQFTFDSPRVERGSSLAEYAHISFVPGRPILDAAVDLTERIHEEFEYDPRATTVATPVGDVMQHRRGVCQDFAHLQIAMLRSLGLAARYVSGYVRTNPPPGRPRMVGSDASHAWLSLFCGEFGWIDVDPTNNKLTRDEHITLAWGRDYNDVSPIKGVYVGGRQHALSVSVDVVPISDDDDGDS